MNEQVTQPAETETEETETFVPEARQFLLSEIEACMAYGEQVAAYCEQHNIVFKQTFEDSFFDDETNQNMAIAFVPKMKRTGDGKPKELVAVMCNPIPTVETVSASPQGQALLADIIQEYFTKKILQAGKEVENNALCNFPLSFSDFTASRKASVSMEAFNKIGKRLLAMLKKNGGPAFKTMNMPIFRSIMESKAQAETMFPSVPNDTWERILDLMITTAETEKLDTTAFEHWKATRDEITAVAEVDNDSILAAFFGGEEADEDEEEGEEENA